VSAAIKPVLIVNPKSGGGSAQRHDLVGQCGARGIGVVVLGGGEDLSEVAIAALSNGADAIGMAGGDGSQAVVAAVAADRDIPYVCVPAGTRNHFALDLGVDRNDVVGALDAFVDGDERRVDLGEVNGRVFVNNVSLGLYADLVKRPEYRDHKFRALVDTLREGAGREQATASALGYPGQPAGTRAAVIHVSNNAYRLAPPRTRSRPPPMRPRLDAGELGVAVVLERTTAGRPGSARLEHRVWQTAEFLVESGAPVPAGVDGEAATLDPPLRFRSRQAALRVRVAKKR
jgi:diacylglycerol kinase family enzyme